MIGTLINSLLFALALISCFAVRGACFAVPGAFIALLAGLVGLVGRRWKMPWEHHPDTAQLALELIHDDPDGWSKGGDDWFYRDRVRVNYTPSAAWVNGRLMPDYTRRALRKAFFSLEAQQLKQVLLRDLMDDD